MTIEKSVANARHSMELEGFVFTTDELILWQRVADGELPLDDLMDTFERFDLDMRQRHPELYEK